MKIVIAPDSFKECLTALEVARCIESGIRRVWPDAEIVKVPMADGGEGTVRSMVDATNGEIVNASVIGPMGNAVTAHYGLLGDGGGAVIEMAAASGLELVPREARDPLIATTYGTGELIQDALERGVKKIIIGIGGSATCDGGAGMAAALGVGFLDKEGRALADLTMGGGMLDQVASIDITGLDPRIFDTSFAVACDVDNPLCGARGAAHIFGPQKGADPKQVKQLDDNLRHFGALLETTCGVKVMDMPGAGAAGGLGAGLTAFLGATLQSGVKIVIESAGLREIAQEADLIITGEGQVDRQTPFGKTPAGVAKLAQELGVPVVAIGGGLSDDARGVFAHGIDGLESAVTRDMSLGHALENAKEYLENAAERVARMINIGMSMESKSPTS